MKIKRTHPNAREPLYASAGAACFDLYAADVVKLEADSVVYDTGVAFEIPENHVMLVFSRSGQGFKDNIRLANCVGVIDSDFRASVKVKLVSDRGELGMMPQRGDRIAQAMVLPVQRVGFEWTDELSDTERGEGGFGSTGKK